MIINQLNYIKNYYRSITLFALAVVPQWIEYWPVN